ncbi:hypothetical protein ACFVT2_14660 [Streptomyces sp. NPDC058000]|uniref:hypothetical protein n=1 Tax=Streptomyces sp. NPDC058000 TaxID=3346299 RepID=UPI0036DFD474
MKNGHSSPHERMLAYLLEGDQLVPPDARSTRDWEARYDMLSTAAEVPAVVAHPLEHPDLSPEAWYQDGLDEPLGRWVVKW